MSTYKELVYMVLDQLKTISDDSYFTEDHVIFTLEKYRALLLKQRYDTIKKKLPESNYQTLCLNLSKTSVIDGQPCSDDTYLRSTDKLPYTLELGNPRIYPIDYFQGEITFVTKDRLKYVGNNRFLTDIIYCAIGADSYLYFKSCNPQHKYLKSVKFTGVFENPSEAFKLKCSSENTTCDIMDSQFPIDESLISTLIETSVKLLSGALYRPQDSINDSRDDLSALASYISQHLKADSQTRKNE